MREGKLRDRVSLLNMTTTKQLSRFVKCAFLWTTVSLPKKDRQTGYASLLYKWLSRRFFIAQMWGAGEVVWWDEAMKWGVGVGYIH